MSFHRWMQRREYGLPAKLGDGDLIMKRIYTSIEPYHHWNDLSDMPDQTAEFGAVFNLEFSPEGNVLVAACEKKSILLFDAISNKQNHKITNAHTDNVNCIKFLDDRMFATCSDDTTVALWDLRYLKTKVRSLHGHSNWVKNIEYSHKDSLLVTSGFDGSIFTWDINSHTEQGLIYQKVFHTSGLMRCRITPDGSKLVICTTGGYLMIIHDLDLTTLHKDLCGFRPSIYRLMQMGHQHIPQAAKFDHVFSKKQKKNRVELVTDFPAENDAEVILALQIHPQGHSFLSRNISYDEKSEWSCIHDINEEPGDITDQLKDDSAVRKRKLLSDSDDDPPVGNRRYRDNESGADSNDDSRVYGFSRYAISRRHRRHRRLIGRDPPPPPPAPTTSTARAGSSSTSSSAAAAAVSQPTNRPESFVPDIWAAEVTVQERAIRQNRGRSSNSVTGYNFVYAISSGVLPVAAIARSANQTSPLTTRRNTSTTTTNEDSPSSPTLTASTDGASTSSSDSPPLPPYERFRVQSLISPLRNRYTREKIIFENAKKLMYFMKESNTGKGFIKEPSFSSDGRIICSPFESGVRLLAFADDCSEYPRHRNENIKGNPKNLTELKHIKSHSDIVLCTKFSPREPLLVTGCRSGKVVWHHPNL